MLKKITKNQKQKQSDQLYQDLLLLEHHICCDVESLQAVEYDSPTMRKQIKKEIQEWNKLGYDYCSTRNKAD